MNDHTPKHAEPEAPLDLSEKGMDASHARISTNRRMYVQFLAFTGVTDIIALQNTLAFFGAEAALYLDVHDPKGVGLVCMHEDPAFFVSEYRNFLNQGPFASLEQKQHLTMFGRTYSIGYEPNLEEVLFTKPKSRLLNPELPWAIWYPLRRRGAFEELSKEEQMEVMKEHGGIGHRFGDAGHAYDVRLDCHGLDQNDNDFVIALIGSELTPLSKVVEHMRKTKQTSLYLEKLGPFFVGKVCWQSQYSK